jgi:endonuclease/exonuclease/phosphatase family metal-dependent hydrolase
MSARESAAIGRASTCPAPASRTAGIGVAPKVVRVVTLNLHKGMCRLGRRSVLDELRTALRALDADVVCAQEVVGSVAGSPAADRSVVDESHCEYLADAVWPRFAYGRNAATASGHHGNAVLSRWPIDHVANHDASIGRGERRGLLHCKLSVAVDARGLHVICVHLGLRERQRAAQLSILCDLVDRAVGADEPVVVAGDFNDWRRRADAILLARSGLRNVHAVTVGRSPRTFPSWRPWLALDRIYVRGVAAVRPIPLTARPWDRLSDHLPLAAEVTL